MADEKGAKERCTQKKRRHSQPKSCDVDTWESQPKDWVERWHREIGLMEVERVIVNLNVRTYKGSNEEAVSQLNRKTIMGWKSMKKEKKKLTKPKLGVLIHLDMKRKNAWKVEVGKRGFEANWKSDGRV